MIIELNPFFADTGACLFSWKSNVDRDIISKGPFEFRILEKPIDSSLEIFDQKWVSFIKNYRKSIDDNNTGGCVLN